MGWIAFGIALAGFFIASGLESLGKYLIFANGRWEEYEEWKAKNAEKENAST